MANIDITNPTYINTLPNCSSILYYCQNFMKKIADSDLDFNNTIYIIKNYSS